MRLTKQMKKDLLNIIISKTKSPLSTIHEECNEELQQWVYDHTEPCFKEFDTTYGSVVRDLLNFSYYIGSRYIYTSLNVRVPSYSWFSSANNPYRLIAYNQFEVTDSRKNYPDLDKILTKFENGIEQEKEYQKHLSDVESIINSCTTDTRLAEVFPEFVQFFNKAGITEKVTTNLPAKLGLPEALCKYGFKLETVDSVEQQIREETNE